MKQSKHTTKIISAIIILVLLIIGLYYFLHLNPLSRSLEAKLVLSEEKWDFEEVLQGSRVTHEFKIGNLGDQDLVIEKIQASCPCIEIDFDESKNIVRKNQWMPVSVTYNSLGYLGEVNKNVYIYSNDTETEKRKLTIAAQVYQEGKPVIEVKEQDWKLGEIKAGEEQTFELTIKNTGTEDLVIEQIKLFPHIQANTELPLNIIPGTIKKIEMKFDSASVTPGEIREAIWIYSNDPKRERIPVRIQGTLLSDSNS